MDPQKRETYDLMGMEGLEDRVCGAQGGKVKFARLESTKQTESFLLTPSTLRLKTEIFETFQTWSNNTY